MKECVDVIRALWGGNTVTHQGFVRVKEEKFYTRPEVPPLIIGVAITPETARWVEGWADDRKFKVNPPNLHGFNKDRDGMDSFSA